MSEKRLNISVVIPAFNREQTIVRCLKSVVGQTYPAMEILVVDDGSADNTRKIVADFPSDKVSLLCQNHKGAQAARNEGIINAKGEYIAFLDSDDEWLPHMLEETVNCLMDKGEHCVIYSDCYVRMGDSQKLARLPDCEGDSYAALLRRTGPTISMLVKRKLLLEIGLLDEKVTAYQEWDTAIRLAKRTEFVHIHKPLFNYYMHDGEAISKSGEKDLLGYGYIVKKHRKNIVDVCGYGALADHYHLLIKKCIQNKSKKLYMYIWKWYQAELMDMIRRNRV
ncbi:MAG: glycosyltransferase family 2 protein [Dorea sp.]|jgi:glycosyltransferase involved in cell wall biosynthesis|nr:glycosyltransferase family 2 protein [Dorea sp.]